MPLKDLLLVNSMLAFNDNTRYYLEDAAGLHTKRIEHIKKGKDGRKVEYYQDEKGNIRRRKI